MLLSFYANFACTSEKPVHIIVTRHPNQPLTALLKQDPSQINIFFQESNPYIEKKLTENTAAVKNFFSTIKAADPALYTDLNNLKVPLTTWLRDSTMQHLKADAPDNLHKR